MPIRLRAVTIAAVVLALASRPASAQRFPPDSLTNLEYFPKDIAVRALIDSMRQFSFALGVRCTYCHVGEEGKPLATYEFAADKKRPKEVARVMLDMVQQINRQHLADVPERSDPPVVVACMTCHRGRPKPLELEDRLGQTLADSGLDATVRAYRALREEYYGTAAYDFRRGLLVLASDQLRAQHADEALALLRLNAEFFPESAQTAFLMGEAQVVRGDTAEAIASYRAAVANDSMFARGVMQRLRALGVEP